jgi:hypothetical protein
MMEMLGHLAWKYEMKIAIVQVNKEPKGTRMLGKASITGDNSEYKRYARRAKKRPAAGEVTERCNYTHGEE